MIRSTELMSAPLRRAASISATSIVGTPSMNRARSRAIDVNDHVGVEQRREQHRGAHAEPTADEDRASGRVEQRHVVDEHVAGLTPGADHRVVAVLYQPLVVEHRSLREPGGAGGVLDLHRIGRLRVAQLAVVFPCEQRLVIGQQDPVADRREFVAHGVGDLLHRIPTEVGDVVDRLRP